jgi:hypothetical protein
MNLDLTKRPDRVFVLACGKSCDIVDFLPFLKNEYVIAVSRWLFYDGFDFDFYFVNDAEKLIPIANRHGGLSELTDFFASDLVKWTRDADEDILQFEKKGVVWGDNTYGTYPWKKINYGLNHEKFLQSNGEMPVDRPQDYFSSDWFSQYEIPGTGLGTASRCAIDLAYFLRFKTCYIMSVDTYPIPGGGYSKHILEKAVVPGRKKNPYIRNIFWIQNLWKKRYQTYRGMQLRRVVPKDMLYAEQREGVTDKLVLYKLGMFKNVLYEDLIDDNPEVVTDIKYHSYVP